MSEKSLWSEKIHKDRSIPIFMKKPLKGEYFTMEDPNFEYNHDYFANMSSLIMRYLDYYHKSVIDKLWTTKRYVVDPEKFYYTIMYKTYNTLDAANIFICNYASKPTYHPSLGILIRSMLSDILVGHYVSLKSQLGVDAIDLINRINTDHIDRTLNSIGGVYAWANGWDKLEQEKRRAVVLQGASKYFDDNGDLIYRPLKISPERIIKEAFTQKRKDQDFTFLRRTFHHYDIYSKFEHLGELSFNLLHRPFMEGGIKDQFYDVYECIYAILVSLTSFCRIWGDLFIKEIAVLEKLETEIYNFSPDRLKD